MNPCSTPSLVGWGWGGICCHVAAWLNRNVICLPSPLCPGPGYKSTALLLAADGGNRQADTQTLAVFAKNCLRTPPFHKISATFLVFVRTNRTLYLQGARTILLQTGWGWLGPGAGKSKTRLSVMEVSAQIMDYQSPYFQLIIEQLGSSNTQKSSSSFGLSKSILSFEMIVKFHQAHKTHRSILKTSWKNPANILRTSRKHHEDIYRISRQNPKTSVIICENLGTSEHILNTSENRQGISVIN